MKNISNNYPEWNATGTEPDQSKKDEGWQAGEKPPADWFNWKDNKGYQSFQDIDAGIADRISDVLTEGVLTGGEVTENTTADLNVLVEPLTGFNPNGARINLESQQIVDLSSYLPTTSGNEKYVSVYIDVVDLETNTEINIVEGTPATASNATKPAIDNSQGVLLADVLLAEGQTTIINGDIEEVRKKKINLKNIAGQTDFVNVKDFGAKGDGSDESQAILNAIKTANLEGKILYFPKGKYLIKEESVQDNSINACSMTGYNATLIVDGNIGFVTTDIPFLIVENMNFELRNNYRDDTENFDGVNRLFFGNHTINNARRIYRNINAYGVVSVEDGTERYYNFVREHNITNNSIFRDIEINNFSNGIFIHDSSNFIIDNCNFYNYKTAIWTWDGENYKVHNILAENTFEQSQVWVSKNHPTDPDLSFNGMDLILCNGDNYSLHNLNAINPIERCIYSQGSNVRASKLKSVNSGGFKFVGGGYDDIAKNIKVSDAYLYVNRDLSGTVNNQFACSQIYWAENVTLENFKIEVTDDVLNLPFLGVINISRTAKNIKLENIDCNGGVGNSLAYIIMRKESGLTSEEYLIVENLEINNCKVAKNNRRKGSLLHYRAADASADALDNYAGKNIKITNCEVEYTGDNQDDFWYNYSYTDGFYAENNKANKQPLNNGGIWSYTSTPTKPYNNVILREKNIDFATCERLFVLIRSTNYAELTGGSYLEFSSKRTSDQDEKTIIDVLDTGGKATGNIYKNSHITAVLSASEYINYSDMPDNYTIEMKTTDGYYLGEVNGSTITDVINTPPMTISSDSVGHLKIRGDNYSGKGKITIESTPQ